MAKEDSNLREVDDTGWKTVVEPFPESFPFKVEGDTLIGVYKSVREVEQDDIQNKGQKRLVNVYTVEDGDGKKWGVWGSHNVDLAFADISPESEVRIQYIGTVEIDNGARTVKQFLIQSR